MPYETPKGVAFKRVIRVDAIEYHYSHENGWTRTYTGK